MLAVVKTPRIKIRVEGTIPRKVLTFLKHEYGTELKVRDDEELVDFFETSIYKKTKTEMTPGVYMTIYRENMDMTQEELGRKLGVSKSYVCDMEKGRRGISKRMARKLAALFGISMLRFLE